MRIDEERFSEAQIRKFAWACLAASVVSVLSIVAHFMYGLYQVERLRTHSEVSFPFAALDRIQSYEGMEVVINGERQAFPKISRDSTDVVEIGVYLKESARPTGAITSQIVVIDGRAMQILIDFNEAPGETARYSISPKRLDCDSVCREFYLTKQEIDSLVKRVHLLSMDLEKMSPHRKSDTSRLRPVIVF